MIPPDANAAFVATMEDVLEVYQRPHDPQRPLVCLDETSKQLIIDTRAPIPAKPGQPARHDYEYERNGVANLFMVFAPLEGWRHVKVTDRHTAIDYAHVLRDLSDTHFPDAAKIVLVQDNLNIHKPASLYEAFPALQECLARCLACLGRAEKDREPEMLGRIIGGAEDPLCYLSQRLHSLTAARTGAD